MPIFEKLRTPEAQLARHEDDTDVLIKGPPVILVDDRLFRAYDILPLVLKRWGYRHVARRAECRADLYVRPLPLWVIHVVLQFVYLRFLYALHWLYQNHLIRFACPEGYPARLRDIRPSLDWRRGAK